MQKELATFILNQVTPNVGYWERDVNCFVGHRPIRNINGVEVNSIKRICLILFNTNAALVGDLPDRADQEVQVWNRHESYFKAKDDAQEFFDVLHGSSQWELPIISSGNVYTAMIIDAVAGPAVIENPDSKGRFVFSCNYLFRICNP